MAKKFTTKTRNKLVAKVDRWFTYDNRHEFSAATTFHHHAEDHSVHTHVYIGDNSKYGMFLVIAKKDNNGNEIVRIEKYAQTMSDINLFVKQVKLLG